MHACLKACFLDATRRGLGGGRGKMPSDTRLLLPKSYSKTTVFKTYEFTRNSSKKSVFSDNSEVQIPSKFQKNNSQGRAFGIISCQRS